jgi:hypothetical protein
VNSQRASAWLSRRTVERTRSSCSLLRRVCHLKLPRKMSNDPNMQAVAPTMPYDSEVMGDSTRGGTIPEDLVRAAGIPTLVIAGGRARISFGTPPPGSQRSCRTGPTRCWRVRTMARPPMWLRRWLQSS